MDKGIVYGGGVGPGDPELLTIKALKVIKECDAIALPVSGTADKTQITAYQIVWKIYPEIDKKRIIFLSMPMIKDKKALQQVHAEGAEQVCRKLDKGENVAFLTLGDVSIYSTFLYIQKLVEASGYETRVIPGVPSFWVICTPAIWPPKASMTELVLKPSTFFCETDATEPVKSLFFIVP